MKFIYTENDSKVGNLARRLRKFFVWSERPLCKHKARVKTKNVLHSQRSQKPTFESFSVYSLGLLLFFCFANHFHLHAVTLSPPALSSSPSTVKVEVEADEEIHHRPGTPLTTTALNLGPLSDLAGTWVGNGFVLISLPDFSSVPPSTGPAPFRLKLNRTIEILELNPIGAAVPNRGVISAIGSTTGQPDIPLFGLTYLQRISDFITKEPLHIEPGIWIHIPPTTVFPDESNEKVVRMANIPHGDSFLAQSIDILNFGSGPQFDVLSTTPISIDGAPFPPGFLDPFINPPLPPGIKLSYVANPNQLLKDDIAGQKIIDTIALVISTNIHNAVPPVGGVLNIPFVTLNANATQLDAIFFIETVEQPDGTTFLQLQYTQRVVLDFLGFLWPHIQVATLIKQ